MGEYRTLSFQDKVNAAAVKTITSKIINQPFYLRGVQVEFALGQNGLVQVQVAIDNDDSIPTTIGANIGDNVLTPYSPSLYLRGNNTVRDFRIDKPTPNLPAFVKVRANNTDPAAQHSINVIVQIEMLTQEEYEQVRSP